MDLTKVEYDIISDMDEGSVTALTLFEKQYD